MVAQEILHFLRVNDDEPRSIGISWIYYLMAVGGRPMADEPADLIAALSDLPSLQLSFTIEAPIRRLVPDKRFFDGAFLAILHVTNTERRSVTELATAQNPITAAPFWAETM
jgi:hypothetical protein